VARLGSCPLRGHLEWRSSCPHRAAAHSARLFPTPSLQPIYRRPLRVFCVGGLQFSRDARFPIPLVYFNRGIFNHLERRIFQRARALPSRPISKRGLMSQALSPPDADRAAPSSRKGGSSFLGANVV
jgi:hypothetical protein